MRQGKNSVCGSADTGFAGRVVQEFHLVLISSSQLSIFWCIFDKVIRIFLLEGGD